MNTLTFTVHEHHTVKVELLKQTGQGVVPFSATCETCSLGYTVYAAIKFMCEHNVRSLVVDGCPIQRIR